MVSTIAAPQASMGELGERRYADDSAGDDPLYLYLQTVGSVTLLSREREIELAEAIQRGQQAAELLGSVGGKKKVEYLAAVRRGAQAKEQLVAANLRLVVSIAKRYRNRGVAFLDLIQEGNIGLMRAADKFDPGRGFKFSTLATWWIRQSIIRVIYDQARSIRIPVHTMETVNKIRWAQRRLYGELGREPTVEELAAQLGLAPQRVEDLLAVSRDVVSLELPVGGEESCALGDLIADEQAISPADVAAISLRQQAIDVALSALSERERGVVTLRFGLDGEKSYTLEEVGVAYGVTRERIRQIEVKALSKLRHSEAGEALRDYCPGL